MNNLKNINYRVKIFFCLLICTVVPITILGLYSYDIYISNINKEVDLSQTASIDQLKLRMDTTIMDIKKYYIEAADDEEVTWFTNNDVNYSDYTNLSKVQGVLSCSAHLSQYIRGYTLINYDTDWIISNRGLYTFDELANREDVDNIYNMQTDGPGTLYMINNMDLYSSSNKMARNCTDITGLLLVIKLPISKNVSNSLLIVNLDLSAIAASALTNSEVMEITILDSDGKLVYGTDEEVAKYITGRADGDEEVSKAVYINETIYNTKESESDVVKWDYYVSWNMNFAKEGAIDIVFTTIIMMVAAVMIVLVICVTNIIYRPVRELKEYVKEVSNTENADIKENEFQCISDKIHELVDDNAVLNKKLDAEKEQLSEFLVNRLISGNLRKDQIDVYFNKLGICHYKFYAVMVLGIRNYMHGGFDEARQDALRLDVMENIPQDIKKRLMMAPSCNARVITLVAGGDEREDLDTLVVEIYKGIEIYVQMKYEFPVKVGVSSAYTDLSLFRSAHNEAIEALKNNQISYNRDEAANFSGVMFYSDIAEADAYDGCTYDRLLEKEINEAVDACDQEKAFEIVDRFILSLSEHKVLGNERKFYLYRFMVAILLVASDAGLSLDEVFKEYNDNIFETLITIYDINRIGDFYKYKMIIPIMNSVKSFRTSRSSEIIREITDMIEQHGGNITLTECADALHYHPTYIWKIMKIEKNTTFSDYVSRYKLEEAKRLLENTDMTVNDIASKLNYTNSQNFIRFFNRIEGITPGKYRQTIKGSQS